MKFEYLLSESERFSNHLSFWTELEIIQLRKEYESKMEMIDISRSHKRTIGSIYAKLRELGYPNKREQSIIEDLFSPENDLIYQEKVNESR